MRLPPLGHRISGASSRSTLTTVSTDSPGPSTVGCTAPQPGRPLRRPRWAGRGLAPVLDGLAAQLTAPGPPPSPSPTRRAGTETASVPVLVRVRAYSPSPSGLVPQTAAEAALRLAALGRSAGILGRRQGHRAPVSRKEEAPQRGTGRPATWQQGAASAAAIVLPSPGDDLCPSAAQGESRTLRIRGPAERQRAAQHGRGAGVCGANVDAQASWTAAQG